jgi:methyltransferase (TIGR00027 family)
LWRALHATIDPPPHVLEDTVGLALISPHEDWRNRDDMDPQGSKAFRASIVARARFVEDFVIEEMSRGVDQYVILGAGLDTFAQRRREIASRLTVFEIDQADTQAWKRRRLTELGYGIPRWLRFVPVDFETTHDWPHALAAGGFDARKPAVIAATGLSMYLTRDALAATLRQAAQLAAGSAFAMTFIQPFDRAASAERPALETARSAAQAGGTPFRSFFTPDEMLAFARDAGFGRVEIVSSAMLSNRYFAGRSDGLGTSAMEEFLVARTREQK